jgi:hypothetical protein
MVTGGVNVTGDANAGFGGWDGLCQLTRGG